jgi:hypothetical protein
VEEGNVSEPFRLEMQGRFSEMIVEIRKIQSLWLEKKNKLSRLEPANILRKKRDVRGERGVRETKEKVLVFLTKKKVIS